MIGNAQVLERDTKTEAGERVLPLPEPARQALIAYKALQEIEQMSMGAYYKTSGYMFVDHLGEPLTTRHLSEGAYSPTGATWTDHQPSMMSDLGQQP